MGSRVAPPPAPLSSAALLPAAPPKPPAMADVPAEAPAMTRPPAPAGPAPLQPPRGALASRVGDCPAQVPSAALSTSEPKDLPRNVIRASRVLASARPDIL